MSILFDTNIFTRAAQPGHPQQKHALLAGDTLKARGEHLCIVPQILYEFWSVATRPLGENGLGLTTAQARDELSRIKRLFPVLPDTPAILPLWEELVTVYDVKGKNSHDVRLVACMKVYDITNILTFNAADFARYPGITVISPETIGAFTGDIPGT